MHAQGDLDDRGSRDDHLGASGRSGEPEIQRTRHEVLPKRSHPFDPERVKALLKEAGVASGSEIALEMPKNDNTFPILPASDFETWSVLILHATTIGIILTAINAWITWTQMPETLSAQ